MMSYANFFMRKEICHIYGPISLWSYGLAIVIGLTVFSLLIRKDPWYTRLGGDSVFSPLITAGIFAAILGGRIVYWFTETDSWSKIFDIVKIWEGGFSILGAILGVLCIYPLYLYKNKIPMIETLDLIAVYAPILQSISRLGCFCAGCCYGCSTTVPWAVMYTDPRCDAPLQTLIHPTQLYSAFMLFLIFIALYSARYSFAQKKGQLMGLYLVFVGLERFSLDYWRAERLYFPHDGYQLLSIYQAIALVIATSGCIIFYCATTFRIFEKKL